MSSVNAILRKKKNKQGLYPIAIRITKNRKSSYLYTGHYIELHQWDDTKKGVKKNHPNSTRLNNLILKKLSEASSTIIDTQVEKENIGAQRIKEKIRKSNDDNDFFTIAHLHITTLRNRKQHHQADTEEGRVDIFRSF